MFRLRFIAVIVTIAAVLCIVAASLFLYDRHSARLENEARLRSVKRWQTMLDLDEAQKMVARWDSGDRQFAFKEWGNYAETIIQNKRFMIGVYQADLNDLAKAP